MNKHGRHVPRNSCFLCWVKATSLFNEWRIMLLVIQGQGRWYSRFMYLMTKPMERQKATLISHKDKLSVVTQTTVSMFTKVTQSDAASCRPYPHGDQFPLTLRVTNRNVTLLWVIDCESRLNVENLAICSHLTASWLIGNWEDDR